MTKEEIEQVKSKIIKYATDNLLGELSMNSYEKFIKFLKKL